MKKYAELTLWPLLTILLVNRLKGSALPPWLIVLAFMCYANFTLFTKHSTPKQLLFLALLLTLSLLLNTLCGELTPRLGFHEESVSAVKGRVEGDSAVSLNGNITFTLQLAQTVNQRKDACSASGEVLCVVKGKERYYHGEQLECRGYFIASGVFLSNAVKLTQDDSPFIRFRRTILTYLSQRTARLTPAAHQLLTSLLWGEVSGGNVELRQMVVHSGCAHVLALSGMHLHTLILLFNLVNGRKRGLSTIFAILYVTVVGFKASLVRSLIMVIILQIKHNIEVKKALALTFVTQMLLFPATIGTLASLLSYTCLTAILWLAEGVGTPFLLFVPPKVAHLVGTTLSATLAVAPLALALFDAWYPIGLLVSPLLALLALSILSCGFIYLFLPLMSLGKTIEFLYTLFYRLAQWGSEFTARHPPWSTGSAWCLALLLLLTVIVLLKYAKQVIQKRIRATYDLEFSLQFPPRHH